MESVVCVRLEATAPWGLSVEAGEYAYFGTIYEGVCWLTTEFHSGPILLSEGDCFILAPGSTLVLRDAPTTPVIDIPQLLDKTNHRKIRLGGGGAQTRIIGGRFKFSQGRSEPLLDLLPGMVHVPAGFARTAALSTTLELLAAESAEPAPGSPVVLNRLADVFFIHALRAYLGSDPTGDTAWLRALTDPQIGAALKAMHEKIEHPWTVVALASLAGMSRSAFASRFKELVGQGPLEYLTRWRMYKAGRLLRDEDKTLFEVANSVGYESDGAFHKAFKRVLGVTPGEYRRGAST